MREGCDRAMPMASATSTDAGSFENAPDEVVGRMRMRLSSHTGGGDSVRRVASASIYYLIIWPNNRASTFTLKVYKFAR